MHFQACAYCTHPNPVGTNYCNHCGAALHLKPCRHCGAVAVAKAHHCPACRREFPHRPTINVGIPWAVASPLPAAFDPEGGDILQTPKPVPGTAPDRRQSDARQPDAGQPDARQTDASAEALAATQRLIEKASSRELPADHQPELVFPGHGSGRSDGLGGGHHGRRGAEAAAESSREAARRQPSPMPLTDIYLAEETAGLQVPEIDEPRQPANARRYAPLVVLSVLGLMAAIALVYLLRYAGDARTGSIREIASPHRLLLPATPRPTAAPAAEESPLDASTVEDSPLDALNAGEAPLDRPRAAAPPPSIFPPVQQSLPVPTPPVQQAQPFRPVERLPQPAAPTKPSDCRAELQALNLCGKVNPTR